MKKIHFILFFGLLVVAGACSKKDATPAAPTTSSSSTCALATLKTGQYTETYYYDSKGNMIKRIDRQDANSNPVMDSLVYDASGLVFAMLHGKAGEGFLYDYNKDKTLKTVSAYKSNTFQNSCTYTWGGGRITQVRYNTTDPVNYTVIGYDDNGNVGIATDYNTNLAKIGWTKYEYDSKKNPYASGIQRFLNSGTAYGLWGPNNVTKQTSYDGNGNVINGSVYTDAYQYGSNDYPTQDVGFSGTTTFTYNCH